MSQEKQPLLNWRWALLAALVPLIILGLYFAYVLISKNFRLDEAFFTEAYLEKYFAPSAVAQPLERALQTGDDALYRELTGLRGSPSIEHSNPAIIFSILLDVDEQDYFHYMYFNVDTFERLTYYLKKESGRWVVAHPDAYFYYDSGQWSRIFMPLALVYWGGFIAIAGFLFVYRWTARMRQNVFDR